MNKFKVGDRVKLIEVSYLKNRTWYTNNLGKTMTVKRATGRLVDVVENPFSFNNEWLTSASPDRHELHITSDGTTTNAVYKLNGKVEKTAKAVCCPSDTFNFNTGAELAINRVLYGTDYGKNDVAFKAESAPKQGEPKYAVGQRVIATDNVHHFVKQPATILHIDTSDHNTPFKVKFDDRGLVMWCRRGDIEPYSEPSLTVTRDMLVKLGACGGGLAAFDKYFSDGKGEYKNVIETARRVYRESDANWLEGFYDKIEAMQNQPKEAVMLYCVKDYKELSCDTIFTRGKLYEVDKNGQIKTDTGFTTYRKWGSDEMKIEFPVMSKCLIRAEKRPAKKDEYVVIVDETGSIQTREGDVLKCVGRWYDGASLEIESNKGFPAQVYDRRYLVLPDYQSEKVEPTYFSGKVVCVKGKGYHTLGKVYEVKNGIINDNQGKFDYNIGSPCKNIDELNKYSVPQFISYLGEQSC